MSEFTFVDNNAPLDAHWRKEIRSHVMRRRNQGKKVAARGWKHAPAGGAGSSATEGAQKPKADKAKRSGGHNKGGKKKKKEDSAVASEELQLLRTRKALPSPASCYAGAEFACFDGPVTLPADMNFLMAEFEKTVHYSMYPPLFCFDNFEAKKGPFFQFVVSSEASLHCFVAIAGAAVAFLRGQFPIQTPRHIRHLSKAMNLVNRDLSRQAIPDDAILASVASLSVHSHFTHNPAASHAHLEGLKRMIALRPGGMASIRAHPASRALAAKISRTDVEFALMEGGSTRFGAQCTMAGLGCFPAAADCPPPTDTSCEWVTDGDDDEEEGQQPQPQQPQPQQHQQHQHEPQQQQQQQPPQGRWRRLPLPAPLIPPPPPRNLVLEVALDHSLRFSRFINAGLKLEPGDYQDAIIALLQLLIDFAPLDGPRPDDPAVDAWQLGLLSFASTILWNVGRLRALYASRLCLLLQRRLEDEAFVETCHPSFLLWLYLFSGISVTEGRTEGRSLFPPLRELASRIGVTTWEEAKAHLVEPLPWVVPFHDTFGKRVWTLVSAHAAASTTLHYPVPDPAPAATVADPQQQECAAPGHVAPGGQMMVIGPPGGRPLQCLPHRPASTGEFAR